MKKKKIVVLGASGQIGQTALKLIKSLDFELVGVSYFHNTTFAQNLRKTNRKVKVFSPVQKALNNVSSYEALLIDPKPDLVVNAIAGASGLPLSVLVLQNKINLALANKESMVLAGWLLQKMAKQNQVMLMPIDSELSALYDALKTNKKPVAKLYLTASGSHFYQLPVSEWANITYQEATTHPKWAMGAKTCLDSATFVNKCLEMICAHYWFNNLPIDVVIEPTAHVHAIIQFTDNSYQLLTSQPDMAWAVQSGLTCYYNQTATITPLALSGLQIAFHPVDETVWKPIAWAKASNKHNNLAWPVVLNSANEVAIELFSQNIIGFQHIHKLIALALQEFNKAQLETLHDIYQLIKKVNQFCLQNSTISLVRSEINPKFSSSNN